ncbi:MAG: protein O-GlcNAcase, partial [Actinomycetota bacterium]|nr:protein O-GlcNAcase [Actinomycetota bacterium]
MDRSVRGADSLMLVLRPFAVRGVVEGFYGAPWKHDARLEVMSFLAARGMNAYAYAPKDDARHRAEWRVTYEETELDHFRELAAHGAARATLLRKLQPLRDAGVSWILLVLDDIPMKPGLAPRQAALVAGMPPDVDVMWTGPTLCSPELRADDARGWTKAFGDRRVIVWDNYPVNDALMAASLHLGPYVGRDADLADVVGGEIDGPDCMVAVADLRGELRAARALSEAFPEPSSPDDPLSAEVGPWAASAGTAAEAGLSALR